MARACGHSANALAAELVVGLDRRFSGLALPTNEFKDLNFAAAAEFEVVPPVSPPRVAVLAVKEVAESCQGILKRRGVSTGKVTQSVFIDEGGYGSIHRANIGLDYSVDVDLGAEGFLLLPAPLLTTGATTELRGHPLGDEGLEAVDARDRHGHGGALCG